MLEQAKLKAVQMFIISNKIQRQMKEIIKIRRPKSRIRVYPLYEAGLYCKQSIKERDDSFSDKDNPYDYDNDRFEDSQFDDDLLKKQ